LQVGDTYTESTGYTFSGYDGIYQACEHSQYPHQ
jgi:hypothetical protein